MPDFNNFVRRKRPPVQPKNHSIQAALLAAGEIENSPSRRVKANGGQSKRTAKPARSTLKRDSEVTLKLAALPRPLKPPGRS